jgi:NTP pyrophosphatase (non-canonical NTP hydrolase)
MKTYAEMLDEWSQATGGDPRGVGEWADLREKLITEEYQEVLTALDYYVDTEDAKPLAKELADLVYVCFGTTLKPGIDLDAAFRIVHESNMSKIIDGKVLTRPDGKVMKPDNYKTPDVSPAVNKEVMS